MKLIKERRVMIRKDHSSLSIVKQSKLLQIHRSGLYYKSKGESTLNLELMQLMDEYYTHHCFKGANCMHTWLTRQATRSITNA